MEEQQQTYEGQQQQQNFKICGLVEYNKAILFGLFITVTGVIWVYFNLDDEEEQMMYFGMGAFNVTCLGMTYFLGMRLNKRVKENAEQKAK